jgi:hypothetical protein
MRRPQLTRASLVRMMRSYAITRRWRRPYWCGIPNADRGSQQLSIGRPIRDWFA